MGQKSKTGSDAVEMPGNPGFPGIPFRIFDPYRHRNREVDPRTVIVKLFIVNVDQQLQYSKEPERTN